MLVGAPASGKTTLRGRLQAAGAAPARTVSLDEERAVARERDVAAGREPRPLQEYSATAVRRCEAAVAASLAAGLPYLADATHLRRRDRVAHVRAAHAAGLRAVAVLMPHLDPAALARRDAARPPERRVPAQVLARCAHRRGLLSAELLVAEGFDAVVEAADLPPGLGDLPPGLSRG
ncbi:AAA family ATPase [Quadrisphaera sp. DSM 44207]|uniref:AAA family ATPase n=1 Tax=Quadrisphaera sp. DSM 44207 TaxID=1881057 RepID=UPI00088643C2|nr:AAA family ATPase [Quadrisphaera sp. DSM 44207]SDQ08006.1 Predicted kinase [Quadrisphaera sp. DSM 44207]